MNDERAGGERRTFDPDRPESRKFLAARIGGLDRQGPCHGAEGLARRHGPEKARPLENGEVGKTVRTLRENAETGKTDVADVARNRELAEVEEGRIVEDAARFGVRDQVDFHRGPKR